MAKTRRLDRSNGTLVLFPSWPTDSDVSFTRLRGTGAFIVTAQWRSGVVASPVRVLSERGGELSLAKPWAKLCATAGGKTMAVKEHAGLGLEDVDPMGRAIIATEPGKSYQLTKC